jgi:HEAT repeat protein
MILTRTALLIVTNTGVRDDHELHLEQEERGTAWIFVDIGGLVTIIGGVRSKAARGCLNASSLGWAVVSLVGRGMQAFRVLAFSALFCAQLLVERLWGAEPASSDVGSLIRLLESDDSKVRYKAACSLRGLGAQAQPAIRSLVRVLGDYGAPTGRVVQYAGPCVRDVASAALARIGLPAVPAVAKALGDTDEAVRSAAASTLGKMGPVAKPAFFVLADALNEPEDWVRSEVIHAIARVGADPKRVVPLLVKALQADQEYGTRVAATRSLRDADSAGTLAMPLLVAALKDPEWGIIFAAAETLGQFGAKGQSAVAALIDALSTKAQRMEAHFDFGYSVPVRRDVARALGDIGPSARSAVPALNRVMREDDDRRVRLWAAVAIVRITGQNSPSEPPLRLLIETVHEEKGRYQQEAAEALGATCCDAAVTALIDVLSKPDSTRLASIRASAARALGQLGPQAHAAVPGLRLALVEREDWYFFLHREAAIALGKIGTGAKAAIPDLIQATRSDDEWLRDAATNALRAIDPQRSLHRP